MVFITRSFEEAITYVFFPLRHFTNIGQKYVVTLVPAQAIQGLLYPEGVRMNLIISPFVLLMITGFIFFFLTLFQSKKRLHFSSYIIASLFFILLETISATNSTVNSQLSLLLSSSDLFFIVTFILIFQFIRDTQQKDKSTILHTIIDIISIMALLEGIIVILQTIFRTPIVFPEQVLNFPYFGRGADESTLIFRPIGLQGHPNILAIVMLEYFILISQFTKYMKASQRYRLLYNLAQLLALFSIAISASRTVYFLVFPYLLLLTYTKRKIIYGIIKNNEMKVYHLIFLLIVTIIISIYLPIRIVNTFSTFYQSGGWYTRDLLNQDAFNLIIKNPIWGIGKGLFIPSAFAENFSGLIRYYPERVHNAFLLLWSESGTFAFIASIGVICAELYVIFSSQFDRLSKIVFEYIVFSECFFMFFQTDVRIFSSAMLIVVLLCTFYGKQNKEIIRQ